jgi:hypothetical protein
MIVYTSNTSGAAVVTAPPVDIVPDPTELHVVNDVAPTPLQNAGWGPFDVWIVRFVYVSNPAPLADATLIVPLVTAAPFDPAAIVVVWAPVPYAPYPWGGAAVTVTVPAT